jgi:hypothetical protein
MPFCRNERVCHVLAPAGDAKREFGSRQG